MPFPCGADANLAYNLLIAIGLTSHNNLHSNYLSISLSVTSPHCPLCDPGLVSFHRFHSYLLLIPNPVCFNSNPIRFSPSLPSLPPASLVRSTFSVPLPPMPRISPIQKPRQTSHTSYIIHQTNGLERKDPTATSKPQGFQKGCTQSVLIRQVLIFRSRPHEVSCSWHSLCNSFQFLEPLLELLHIFVVGHRKVMSTQLSLISPVRSVLPLHRISPSPTSNGH
ncbi:hypothetical protein QCA50_005875 [Cerrena zonata]|uniref:Uncharacterized protein n=1 Tax=Cerrena zonata TaxID=2478898 RepID=A0AAW0GCX1_9APHY